MDRRTFLGGFVVAAATPAGFKWLAGTKPEPLLGEPIPASRKPIGRIKTQHFEADLKSFVLEHHQDSHDMVDEHLNDVRIPGLHYVALDVVCYGAINLDAEQLGSALDITLEDPESGSRLRMEGLVTAVAYAWPGVDAAVETTIHIQSSKAVTFEEAA
jgi:hypothetical protein